MVMMEATVSGTFGRGYEQIDRWVLRSRSGQPAHYDRFAGPGRSADPTTGGPLTASVRNGRRTTPRTAGDIA
jgi:hypothetical protein